MIRKEVFDTNVWCKKDYEWQRDLVEWVINKKIRVKLEEKKKEMISDGIRYDINVQCI